MPRFLKWGALCLCSAALLLAQTPPSAINPVVKRIVDEISQERIAANLKKFEGFGTRYVMSSDDDPLHGIGAAKRWIYGEFKSYSPKLEVSYQTFRVRKGARRGQVLREVELANVVAILPGTVDRDRYVLVTAHYDTVNLHRKPQFTDAERVADLVKHGMEEAEAQRVIQLFPTVDTIGAANVNVVFRDDTGAPIGTGNVSLPASGHTSFVLSTQFPFTANLRGTAEFDTPVGGQISLLGIRYTGGTLTTIPVLANVGTNGGSIAHIAASNGWTTTFVLVNTGSAPAQANLNFFADDGTPLALPISFPQVGSAVSTSATVSRTIAAGASLLVQSTGPVSGALLTGSAQLTTNGNVGGFVIFRYEPRGQEAVVPLENRNAGAYLLAFDNTASTATGVAVNNASAAAVSIPVILRDDTGVQVGTGTIPLNANGQTSFVLATRIPATANIRGTIEFDTPAGAMIGALGIRTPVALTFTTLPALAK